MRTLFQTAHARSSEFIWQSKTLPRPYSTLPETEQSIICVFLMRAFYIILRDTKNGNLLIVAFTHWGCTCAVFRVAGQYYHVPISIIPCNHLWCSVTSLSMNPKNDTFLSASTYVCQLRPFSTSQHNVTRLLTQPAWSFRDGSIRLWDLRTRKAQVLSKYFRIFVSSI